MFVGCLVVYALLLTIPVVPRIGRSQMLPDYNFAIYIDRLVMGRLVDDTQYTWLLSGFGFIATTLSGLFAGELIKSNLPQKNVALQLLFFGMAGVLLGLIIGIWHSVVKKLWTNSFVLLSSGVCFLLLSLFYWIIDVRGKFKWLFPLKAIGMNTITAYVLSHVASFPQIADYLLFGLEQYVGEFYGVIKVVGNFGILYLLYGICIKTKPL